MSLYFQKLDKFELFPMLPLEIRRLIWEESIVPRCFKAVLRKYDEIDEDTGNHVCVLGSYMKNPALFSTYTESRLVVRDIYRTLLGDGDDDSFGNYKFFYPRWTLSSSSTPDFGCPGNLSIP